jgi:sugar lactone lactonase YvrE
MLKKQDQIELTTKVVHPPSILGEGVSCYSMGHDMVMWVDILGNKIYRMNENTSDTGKIMQLNKFLEEYDYPSLIIPIQSYSHLFLIAFKNTIVKWNIDSNCIEDTYASIDLANVRFNDGKCDPRGRLWIGTTHLLNQPNQAMLYCLKSSEESSKFLLRPVLKNISISNGLAWSLNGEFMYYIDTPTQAIHVYQYDINTGNIFDHTSYNYQLNDDIKDIKDIKDKDIKDIKDINPFIIFDLSQEMGVPDGMNIDSEGMLWVAMWDGSQILRIDPKLMQVINRIPLKVSRPTNVAVSCYHPGRLYVTSAWVSGESESGQLLVIETGGEFMGRSFSFVE